MLLALSTPLIVGLCVLVVLVFLFGPRYRRCPPNHLLVVYGKVGGDRACVVLHRGGRWVWPIFQRHAHLSRAPISVTDADGRAVATVRIGEDPERRMNAGVQLVMVTTKEIAWIALQILERSGYPIGEEAAVEELKKVGLELVRRTGSPP